jgi:hypothetical protein
MCDRVTHGLFSIGKDRGQRCDHHCLYAEPNRRSPNGHGPNLEPQQQVEPLHDPREFTDSAGNGVGDGVAVVAKVNAGSTANWHANGSLNAKGPLKCALSSVTRTSAP